MCGVKGRRFILLFKYNSTRRFIKKCLNLITSLPTKRISATSQCQAFLRVLPTRWRRKAAGIEIVTVIVCIDHLHTCIESRLLEEIGKRKLSYFWHILRKEVRLFGERHNTRHHFGSSTSRKTKDQDHDGRTISHNGLVWREISCCSHLKTGFYNSEKIALRVWGGAPLPPRLGTPLAADAGSAGDVLCRTRWRLIADRPSSLADRQLMQ